MSLDELRDRLDGIDRRMLELIAERQGVIRNIIAAKRSTGFPLRDYQREREVFEKGRANAVAVGVAPAVAEEVLRLLIRYSLTIQEQASMHAHAAGGGLKALVIGGASGMGAWFAQFLYSQGFAVQIADPRASAADADVIDWRTAQLDHDYIVVATPLGVVNEILLELAARQPAGVVFDVASLKSPVSPGLRALRDAGVAAASIHPMFGPDTELLSGRHVIVVDIGDPAAQQKVVALFRPTMAELVTMQLDEHDHAVAYVLGMTHTLNIAFLEVLRQSGESAPRLAQLSSTTFNAQFEVARQVSTESPALYHSIQFLNGYTGAALHELAQAVNDIRAAAAAPDGARFAEIMSAGRRYAEDRRRN
jgi:chorismate mutase / prephenate dehydrogenase